MKQRIISVVSILILLVTPIALTGEAFAACATGSGPQGQILSGAAAAGNCNATSIPKLAKNVVNVLSIVVGIVAVVMFVYGGFRYITSAGDAGRVAGAKNTLIYATVGLVIAALAQFLVHYVLNKAVNST